VIALSDTLVYDPILEHASRLDSFLAYAVIAVLLLGLLASVKFSREGSY